MKIDVPLNARSGDSYSSSRFSLRYLHAPMLDQPATDVRIGAAHHLGPRTSIRRYLPRSKTGCKPAVGVGYSPRVDKSLKMEHPPMPTFKSLDWSRVHLRNCANRLGGATPPLRSIPASRHGCGDGQVYLAPTASRMLIVLEQQVPPPVTP
jgi:hypothetical protein